MIKFPVDLEDIKIHLTRNTFTDPEDNIELTIFGTGEVTVGPFGYSYFDEERKLISTSNIVRDLIAEAMEIGFFEMKSDFSEASVLHITSEGTLDEGFEEMLDGTQIDISIKVGNTKHSIYAHWGYPKRLEEFLNHIFIVCGLAE